MREFYPLNFDKNLLNYPLKNDKNMVKNPLNFDKKFNHKPLNFDNSVLKSNKNYVRKRNYTRFS